MKQFLMNILFVVAVVTIAIKMMQEEQLVILDASIINNEVVETTSETKQMQWTYGGYRFTTQFSINYNSYNYYRSQSKKQAYQNYAKDHATHPYLHKVATILKKDADQLGYTGKDLVEYLTAFVQQNVSYTKDPSNNGYDYPKYPIETLFEQKGDCEDSAILLVSLLKTFGFDAVLIQLPRHMAVGVALPNWKGSYYNFENKKYAYIETTNSKWRLGQLPPEYKSTNAELIKTPKLQELFRLQPIDTPLVTQFDDTTKSTVKTITINGEVYIVKPNETYVIKQNGLVINISNQ